MKEESELFEKGGGKEKDRTLKRMGEYGRRRQEGEINMQADRQKIREKGGVKNRWGQKDKGIRKLR